MRVCRICGGHLHRRHRNWLHRLMYHAVYECDSCGEHEPERRPLFYGFSSTCQCPRCGNERLKTFRRRDYIEGYQRGLFRLLQKWMGAKLRYCDRCRLQFYDLRHTLAERQAARAASSNPQ